MSLKITIEGREKLLAVSNICLSRRSEIDAAVRHELEVFGQHLVRTSKRDYLQGPRPEKLDRVSSRLINSITYLVEDVAPHEFQMTFGTNIEYARIHEKGGPAMAFGKHPFMMKKRSFLRPSWEDEYPAAHDRLRALLAEIAGRLTPNG